VNLAAAMIVTAPWIVLGAGPHGGRELTPDGPRARKAEHPAAR